MLHSFRIPTHVFSAPVAEALDRIRINEDRTASSLANVRTDKPNQIESIMTAINGFTAGCDKVFVTRKMTASQRRAPNKTSRTGIWQLAFAICLLAAGDAAAEVDCSAHPGPNVNWSGCGKERLMLTGDDMKGADLTGTILNGSSLAEANLSGAKLDFAEISRVSFKHADLSDSSLEKTSGGNVTFEDANLTRARLVNVDLSRSNFTHANLTDADFGKAELSRCDFQFADLTGTSFRRASLGRSNLTGANLANTDFTDAYFYRTIIAGADLSRATGLQQDQLDGACGDGETKLPAGLVASSRWPCEE